MSPYFYVKLLYFLTLLYNLDSLFHFMYISYVYVSLSPACESVAWSSLLGQVMNVGVFTELLREFRWWSYPSASNCPWGAVALVALLIGLCCWIGGFITAACLLSHHCRRFVVLVIRALVASVPLPASGPDLRGRLAEYHQRSG